jgi:exosortase F-associated protein
MRNVSLKELLFRFFLVLLASSFLVVVYIFQQVNGADVMGIDSVNSKYLAFSVNKLIRLVLNDLSCMVLIHAIFKDSRFDRLALIVFCIEVFLLLPIYLTLKLTIEGTSEISSPILSQVHRLIVNPMLMIVLIAAFYYQKKIASTRG